MANSCTAFEGIRCIAQGERRAVAIAVKSVMDRGETAPLLVFDDMSGELVEMDLRGTIDQVLEQLEPESIRRRPGRPKLGVVAREVTLLPRHWDWLISQPGGASVALRKLVEEARRANEGNDRIRLAQNAAYRFVSALAGNEAGYEEAIRALFGGNSARFEQMMGTWPPDVREYAKRLASGAFAAAQE